MEPSLNSMYFFLVVFAFLISYGVYFEKAGSVVFILIDLIR